MSEEVSKYGVELNEEALKAPVDTMKKEARAILEGAMDVWQSMDTMAEWGSWNEVLDNISTLTEFAINIVLSIEVAAEDLNGFMAKGDSVSGKEKLRAAVGMLDDAIKLPWYLEAVDGVIFRFLLSNIVSMLNKTLGKYWDIETIRDFLHSGTDYLASINNTMRDLQVIPQNSLPVRNGLPAKK